MSRTQAQSIERTPLLATSKDWPAWIDYIKKLQRAAGIWQYIDPNGTDTFDTTVPELPEAQQTSVYHIELWKDKRTKQARYKERLRDLYTVITTTVSSQLQRNIDESQLDDFDYRGVLRGLQAACGWSERALELTIKEDIARQGRTPKGRDYETWLLRWGEIATNIKALNKPAKFDNYDLALRFVMSTEMGYALIGYLAYGVSKWQARQV